MHQELPSGRENLYWQELLSKGAGSLVYRPLVPEDLPSGERENYNEKLFLVVLRASLLMHVGSSGI
jgi:hypothetical protein